MQLALLYGGAAAVLLWGVGHLIPTRNVVAGFGELSPDNGRILTMEWLIEGLTLVFLGVQVAVVAFVLGVGAGPTALVARLSAGFLLLLAVVSWATGARTAILPMKLCPWIKSAVATAFLVAAAL